MDELYLQWKKDEQFGRLTAWRRRHPERASRLTADEQALVTEAEERITRREAMSTACPVCSYGEGDGELCAEHADYTPWG